MITGQKMAIVLFVVGTVRAAGADEHKKAAEVDLTDPPPGSCSSIQPGVKICSTLAGQGAFDVLTFPPAVIYVTFEDNVKQMLPPDPGYYQTAYRDNVDTIVPLRPNLPERAPTVIETEGVKVTLNLRPGSLAKADTQITVKDPARGVRDAEVDRRVVEKLAPREKELADKERHLEERSAERMELILLDELAQGLDVRGPVGKGIARNDAFIVIRAKEVVRVGSRRYLLMTVENRSAELFDVKGVKV